MITPLLRSVLSPDYKYNQHDVIFLAPLIMSQVMENIKTDRMEKTNQKVAPITWKFRFSSALHASSLAWRFSWL